MRRVSEDPLRLGATHAGHAAVAGRFVRRRPRRSRSFAVGTGRSRACLAHLAHALADPARQNAQNDGAAAMVTGILEATQQCLRSTRRTATHHAPHLEDRGSSLNQRWWSVHDDRTTNEITQPGDDGAAGGGRRHQERPRPVHGTGGRNADVQGRGARVRRPRRRQTPRIQRESLVRGPDGTWCMETAAGLQPHPAHQRIRRRRKRLSAGSIRDGRQGVQEARRAATRVRRSKRTASSSKPNATSRTATFRARSTRITR